MDFIISSSRYPCDIVRAISASPNLARTYMIDPLVDSFEFDFEDPENLFPEVLKLINGESIEIHEKNYDFLINVFVALGNQAMVDEIVAGFFDTQDYEKVVSAIARYEEAGIMSATLETFVAQRIGEFNFDLLKQIPLNCLLRILDNEKLSIDSEDSMLNLVNRMISLFGKEYEILLSRIQCEYLSKKGVDLFLKLTDGEEMSGHIFAALMQRLKSLNADGVLVRRFVYSGDPLNGMLHQLCTECGGNAHKKGLLSITASGTEGISKHPHNVIDYNNNDSWYSKNEKNSWLMFDFGKKQLELTGYAILTPSWIAGTRYPKSWVIQGSNDNENWYEIDKHVDNQDLNGPNMVHMWMFRASAPYRYIRMFQTDKNHSGSDYLCMRHIELFGTLRAKYEQANRAELNGLVMSDLFSVSV